MEKKNGYEIASTVNSLFLPLHNDTLLSANMVALWCFTETHLLDFSDWNWIQGNSICLPIFLFPKPYLQGIDVLHIKVCFLGFKNCLFQVFPETCSFLQHPLPLTHTPMKLRCLWPAFPPTSWFEFQQSPPSTEVGVCISVSSGDFLPPCSKQMSLMGSLSILSGQGDWFCQVLCPAIPHCLCLKMQGLSSLNWEAQKVWQLKTLPSQNFSICDVLKKSALKLKSQDLTSVLPEVCQNCRILKWWTL